MKALTKDERISFLTVNELKGLSHTGQKKPMIEWLEQNHYLFEVGADGWPVVMWAHVHARLADSAKVEPKRPQLMLRK